MPFTASFATSADMVGRDAELDRLRSLFARALDGTPTAVVVSGEPGIGKSRLLREFAASARDEADVVTGRNVDLGTTPTPYGAILGLLRGLVAVRGASAVWQAAGPGRAALLRLLPDLADEADADADTGPASPERLREAFVTLVETLALARPLVLVIEDIQWADEATFTLLSFLLSVATRGRLLVVLSWRTGGSRPRDPARVFVGEATRAGMVERIELARLDPHSARLLSMALLGTDDEDAVDRLTARADGVPLFVEELSRQTTGPLPETLRDTLLGGYTMLSPDAAHVARVASVSAGCPDHDTLAIVSALDGPRLDAAIRETVQAGVMLVDGDGYAFRHALLCDAVSDELLPGERVRLHRAYAEHLQSVLDADPRAQVHAELARHWRGAHDQRRALTAASTAMRAAKNRYAFAAAARFGELALELWDQVVDPEAAAGTDRLTLMLQVASSLRNAGRSDRALATVDDALADPGVAESPALHARLLRDKAVYLNNLGRPGAVDLLEEALRVLDAHAVDDDRLRAVITNYLASRHMVAGRVDAAIATADDAWSLAERSGDRDEMSIARNMRASARMHRGDFDEALADFASAREYAGNTNATLRYYVNYSDTLTMLGRYREAVAVAEEGLDRARALGVERSSGSMLVQNMIEPLVELGEIDRAEALLTRSLDLPTFPVIRAYMTASRVRVLAWRGEADAAAALLRETRPVHDAAATFERQVWYALVEMDIATAEAAGDHVTALRAAAHMLDDDGPMTLHTARILLQGAADVALVRLRGALPRTELDAIAERIETAWDALPAAWCGPRWRTIARSLLHPDAAALARAVDAADAGDVPAPMRIVTRLELSRTLAADRDRPGAASALAEATTLADELHHVPLQRAVAAFGAASGLAAHAGEASTIADAGFTARELQVLALLAEGLTNRQISERLVISVKTVSVHVSAILRKLGVASRTEAAVAAVGALAPAP
ncbi:hypothetical protein LK09_18435 [Microbacterium mangrovi]|uniref:HTH luxR-type domain-containing protein n=1 Tax=Microbacterium mangrovi TaxID=1348253 RepID=A0A0B2A1G7_9MICO|nr:LuxR family transcriptional regulator [Microbacterium mangrovi]KHK95654.1 hypothetical protein LK09_18435 [Microbacterium mangrovi]